MGILDTNPFFERDLDLMPSEEVFTRQILFEKEYKWNSAGSRTLSFAEGGSFLTVAGGTSSASWSINNTIHIGNESISVGWYDISGNYGEENSINFKMKNKPNLFHRTMTKILLGWTWVDKDY